MIIRGDDRYNYSNSANINDSASFSRYVNAARREGYLFSHWNSVDRYHFKGVWIPNELVLDEHTYIYVAQFGRFPNNEDYIYYTNKDGQFYSPNASDLNQFMSYVDSFISSEAGEVSWETRSTYGTYNIYYPQTHSTER